MDYNLENMTVDEKIRVMELLWADLCKNLPEISSPEWHGRLLAERERALKEGNEVLIDWDDAKKDLLSLIQ